MNTVDCQRRINLKAIHTARSPENWDKKIYLGKINLLFLALTTFRTIGNTNDDKKGLKRSLANQ